MNEAELRQALIVKELEDIKAEIIEYRSKHNCGVLECLDILDKHIKEINNDR